LTYCLNAKSTLHALAQDAKAKGFALMAREAENEKWSSTHELGAHGARPNTHDNKRATNAI